MGDDIDANLFSYFFRGGSNEPEKVVSSKIPICHQFADFYNVSHKRRGIALIFNQEHFDDKSYKPREGTKKDRDYLHKVLTKLDFDVRVYNDLKYGQLHEIVADVSMQDHSDADCLLVCVMSHGEEGRIHARDHAFPPDVLWTPFTGDRCPTLAGKPKLFFLQACRGNEVDDGATVRTRTDSSRGSSGDTYSIPAMADILVMYSTYQGYYSWRSPDKGSWFIQALCKELEENSDRLDLQTMLTFVNRRVAISHQSNVPGNKEMHNKKQICPVVSMLTRLMIFPSKKQQLILECDVASNDNVVKEDSVQKLENDKSQLE